MTLDIQGATASGLGTSGLFAHSLMIRPASASIGGASFAMSPVGSDMDLNSVRELLLSAADWHFFISALEAPPALDRTLHRILTEPSVLDRR